MSFRKSDWLDDWYVYEGGSWAIPEGTFNEWSAIVTAVRQRKSLSFKRVAVLFTNGGTWLRLYSPRNAAGRDDHIAIPECGFEDFCREVEAVLAMDDVREAQGSGI